MYLTNSINLTKKITHRHSDEFVATVNLSTIKLTVKINHYTSSAEVTKQSNNYYNDEKNLVHLCGTEYIKWDLFIVNDYYNNKAFNSFVLDKIHPAGYFYGV